MLVDKFLGRHAEPFPQAQEVIGRQHDVDVAAARSKALDALVAAKLELAVTGELDRDNFVAVAFLMRFYLNIHCLHLFLLVFHATLFSFLSFYSAFPIRFTLSSLEFPDAAL